MQIDDARLGVGLRLGPSDRLTDVAEEARSRDAVLTGTAAWTPAFLRFAVVGGVALRTFTESGTTVARGPVPLVGAEAAWERRLSPRFTLGVFARVERDLRAVDLTLDGTSTDAWTPTSVYAGVEVLVL